MSAVAITMSLGDWKLIDAGMDNLGANNRELWTAESDPKKAARADDIRRREVPERFAKARMNGLFSRRARSAGSGVFHRR